MEHDNGDSFSVCETLSDAAESILKNSVAIYRVEKHASNDIGNAWQEARRFFESSQKSSFHRVVNGHLHGFHVPSDAKMLFRSFCSSMQPWPSNDFQRASEQVADKLHKLLVDCLDEMAKIESKSSENDGESHSKRLKMTNSSLNIPNNAMQADNCPLDYFLYHGDTPNAINCSEHVDRGILICVCLTNVPGLEVLPRDSHRFTCPEIQTYNASLYRERQACTDLVCIMAGDQLKILHPEVKACIYRVRNELRQSRLSITYELRAKPT
jgi:isopenicillin N synthase-like dioxygenase